MCIRDRVTYSDMYWEKGIFYGKMLKYDSTLYDYIKGSNVHLPSLINTLIPCLKVLHNNGIYLQNISTKSIYVRVLSSHVEYSFGKVDYAFMKRDFPFFIAGRKWVKNPLYTASPYKPTIKYEAIRNDVYAIAILIGHIEMYLHGNKMLNIFLSLIHI